MQPFIFAKNIFSSLFMIWKMQQQCVVNDTDFKCLEIKTTCFQADCRDYKLCRKCDIFL